MREAAAFRTRFCLGVLVSLRTGPSRGPEQQLQPWQDFGGSVQGREALFLKPGLS